MEIVNLRDDKHGYSCLVCNAKVKTKLIEFTRKTSHRNNSINGFSICKACAEQMAKELTEEIKKY